MTKWILRHIPSQRIAHVFYQDEQPTEEYLSAFRTSDDQDWELIQETVEYQEQLAFVISHRIQNYPELSELADAIYHQQNGNNAPMNQYIQRCLAVKQKYPKPSVDN